MDSSSPAAVKHATAWGVACGAGAALCWALGFVAARQGVTAGLSPLVLALHRYVWPGLALIPVIAVHGVRQSRRHGLAARHRHYDLRRPAARAVELLRLRLRAARPRRHHSAVLRRAWRPCSGAAHRQGAVAGAAHRRRAGDTRRARGDRRRSAAHHGRPSLPRRPDVRRRRQLFCGVRHAAAAVAHSGAAGGRGNERAVARRPAVPIVRFRQFPGRRMVGKPDAGAGAGRLCRRRRGLSVHPRRHSARCRPRRAVSGAGAAVYAVDRLFCARRGAERVAIYRPG